MVAYKIVKVAAIKLTLSIIALIISIYAAINLLKEEQSMNKPIIEFISDGRISRIKLWGYDISKCVRALQINVNPDEEPLNMALSIKLDRLDKATLE